ncbi:MAG: hypothetical protein LBT33_00345, partial [Spirochaetia bacterium]|nr:hypothetical protein [Spirochaetia bacterium]
NESKMKYELDRRELIAEVSEKTRAETRKKTRAEEKKKAYRHLLESARKLKARGVSDGDIADILSLPLKAVKTL